MIIASARQIFGVRARELARTLSGYFQNARGELGHERAIVGDEDDRAFVRFETLDQC